MLNINLLPGEEYKKESSGKFLTFALTYGRYIIISTELIVIFAFISRFSLDAKITDLHESINQKQAVIAASSDFENDVRLIQQRLTLIKAISQKQEIPQTTLILLSQLVPSDVTLSSLSFDEKRISLIAKAISSNSFTVLLNNLSRSSFFSDISLDEIGKNPTGLGVEFKISAVIKEN